ncbi:MAG: DUF447 family protein [Anaerolineae bacterium]
MIIESILTTVDAEGQVNCAPMGVEWGREIIVIKPFKETTTYRNLLVNDAAVVNLTDNVLLFAQSAIASPIFPTRPAEVVIGAVLQDVCSWREVRVEALPSSVSRARASPARVVRRGFAREFLGFNRARHAGGFGSAILATRTHMLTREYILAEFERLQVIVDKTAGAFQEFEAMRLLTDFVHQALAVTGT